MSNEIVKIIEESILEKSKADFLIEKFAGYFDIAKEWEEKAKAIKITDKSQKTEMEMAGVACKFLAEKRIAIEKARKELKESSLREGQAIDKIAKALTALIEPTEQYLKLQKDFIKIKEAEEKAELFRIAQEKAEAERIEAEKIAELERIEKMRIEAEEREKMRIENEKLKAENERIENERKAEAEKQAKILAEQKAESERQAEILRKEQAEILRIERQKQSELQAEILRKEQAEKIEKQRIENER